VGQDHFSHMGDNQAVTLALLVNINRIIMVWDVILALPVNINLLPELPHAQFVQ
jgi:hypothetical protein